MSQSEKPSKPDIAIDSRNESIVLLDKAINEWKRDIYPTLISIQERLKRNLDDLITNPKSEINKVRIRHAKGDLINSCKQWMARNPGIEVIRLDQAGKDEFIPTVRLNSGEIIKGEPLGLWFSDPILGVSDNPDSSSEIAQVNPKYL